MTKSAMEVPVLDFVRPNLRKLEPYRCARDDYDSGILLDANENALGPPFEHSMELNRYPDPHQTTLKGLFGKFRGVSPEEVFTGVGSDEAIDLLMRIVCVPGQHSIMITPPTYGMYKVTANVNDVAIQSVPLTEDFQLRVPEMLAAVTPATRLVFVCSPGNPTANCVREADVLQLLENYTTGLVVVDEAYIDFADQPSFCRHVSKYPHLVVLQTLSKAFGLAGIRLGFAVGNREIIGVMNKVKAPYNVNCLTSELAIQAMRNVSAVRKHVEELKEQRAWLVGELESLPDVHKIFPSDANFVLVRMNHALAVYKTMANRGVVIRYRGNEVHCADCVRITVGTKEENKALMALLRAVLSELSAS